VIADGKGDTSKAAAVVFAATMLVRIPVFLFSGIAGTLLPNFTRLQVERDHGHVTRAVARVCLLFAGLTVVIVTVAAAAGPLGMRLLYGPDYRAHASDLALLGLGAGSYLAAATISQALLARADGWRAAAAWSASAGLFVLVFLVAHGSELHRVALAVGTALVVNTILLAVALAVAHHGRGKSPSR
jgi:O-antigen/teichoic acid export membrane protein